MAGAIFTDEYYAKLRREREAKRKQRAVEFFKSGDPIPDLDMMPPCPICDGGLSYDEGFWCEVCEVQWNNSGYQGERICSCFTKNGVVDKSACFHGNDQEDD